MRARLVDITYKLPPVVCRYVVIAADGSVVLSGHGCLQDDRNFIVNVKDKLPPGAYTIVAALYPNDNAMNTEIRRIAYRVNSDS